MRPYFTCLVPKANLKQIYPFSTQISFSLYHDLKKSVFFFIFFIFLTNTSVSTNSTYLCENFLHFVHHMDLKYKQILLSIFKNRLIAAFQSHEEDSSSILLQSFKPSFYVLSLIKSSIFSLLSACRCTTM